MRTFTAGISEKTDTVSAKLKTYILPSNFTATSNPQVSAQMEPNVGKMRRSLICSDMRDPVGVSGANVKHYVCVGR